MTEDVWVGSVDASADMLCFSDFSVSLHWSANMSNVDISMRFPYSIRKRADLQLLRVNFLINWTAFRFDQMSYVQPFNNFMCIWRTDGWLMILRLPLCYGLLQNVTRFHEVLSPLVDVLLILKIKSFQTCQKNLRSDCQYLTAVCECVVAAMRN